MGKIKIYGLPLSPPFRIAVMTARLLGLEFEIVKTNPINGETRTPEFMKLNPQHNIPCLVDGDIVLNESRAIATYLVNKYGKEDCKLYPKDPKTRAVVDQRLYFDMGTFFKAHSDCVIPILFGKSNSISDEAKARVVEVLGWVRDFLKPTGFVAGTDYMTLADVSFLSTYSTLKAIDQFDLEPYQPELNNWFERCKALVPDYEEVNGGGAEMFGQFFKSRFQPGSQ